MKPCLQAGFKMNTWPSLNRLVFFGEIVARAPEHGRVFAETAAVHERAVGLVAGGVHFVLVKLRDGAEGDAGF